MRKYTGLMAIVFILLAAGFLFTMNDLSTSSGSGIGSGPTILEAGGRILDQQEYRRMGDATLQLASTAGLHAYVNFLMAPDAPQLQQAMQLQQYGYNYYRSMGRNLETRDFNRFIANRIILQQASEQMGIHASDEEVTQAIKTSPRFAPDGKFNNTEYATFIDKYLGRLGMTENDLREVVRESLCLNRLIQIVAGGLIAPRDAIRDQLEAQLQMVTLSRIVFDRQDFAEKEDPSEEEIKSYWETHRDAYKTAEQRRINYILLNLPPETRIESKPAPLPEDATEEQKKAHEEAEKIRKEAEAKIKAQMAEQRAKEARDLQKEIDQIAQEIYDSEEDNKPLDFAAILTKRNHQVVKTDLFSQGEPPAELAALKLRGNVNKGKSIGELIFSHMASSDNRYDLVSDALPVGEHGWIIFTLEEVVEPALQDYESAKDKARGQLVNENAARKVKEAAKAARNAVVELMKSGKTFDEAARDKGYPLAKVGPISLQDLPSQRSQQDASLRRQLNLLLRKASALNPGDVSETIDEKDSSEFFFLVNREIKDTQENEGRLELALNNSANLLMLNTFLNWRDQQYERAAVKGLATEEQ